MLYLLFVLLNLFNLYSQESISSQNQIMWRVEGKIESIVNRYMVHNSNYIVFLVSYDNQYMLKVYDFEKNELVSTIPANNIYSISTSESFGIFVTFSGDKVVYNYDFNGNLVKTIIDENNFEWFYQINTEQGLALIESDRNHKFVVYDIINNQIIKLLNDNEIKRINFSDIIDGRLFINCTKNQLQTTIIYDFEEEDIIKDASFIKTRITNVNYFDNVFVTINFQRDDVFNYNLVFWDRSTLDTIKVNKIVGFYDIFEVVDLEKTLIIAVSFDRKVIIFDYKTNEIIDVLNQYIENGNLQRINDEVLLNLQTPFSYHLAFYNNQIQPISGRIYLNENEFHRQPILSVKIFNNKILTGSYDGILKEWDLSGKFIKDIDEEIGYLNNISISEKHNLIAISYYRANRYVLKIFNAEYDLVFEYETENIINSINFNDDLDKFVVTGNKIPLYIFNSTNFELEKEVLLYDSNDEELVSINSAILLDENELVYTHLKGIRLYNYQTNTLEKTRILYANSLHPGTSYLQYLSDKDEILISGGDYDVFKSDRSLENIKIFETVLEYYDGSKISPSINKFKYLDNNFYYIMGRDFISVYDEEKKAVIYNYNQTHQKGVLEPSQYVTDYDFNDNILVVVNELGDIFGLVPFQEISSVKNSILPEIIFPNPSSDLINFDVDYFDEAIIFNSNGLIVKHLSQFTNQLNVSDLLAGTYFVKFKLNQKTFYSKFIKL